MSGEESAVVRTFHVVTRSVDFSGPAASSKASSCASADSSPATAATPSNLPLSYSASKIPNAWGELGWRRWERLTDQWKTTNDVEKTG